MAARLDLRPHGLNETKAGGNPSWRALRSTDRPPRGRDGSAAKPATDAPDPEPLGDLGCAEAFVFQLLDLDAAAYDCGPARRNSRSARLPRS